MSDWIIRLIDAGGYWGIAFLMVLENIVPPVPSELIMGVGGIRVGQGRMDLAPLLLAGTVGTTIGNYVWYEVGRRLGMTRLRRFVLAHGRWLTLRWREVEWLDGVFERHGEKIVFIFRFLPALRTMVSLPAGLFAMSPLRFILWTFAGSLIWNIFLVGCGWYLGARFAAIDDWLGPIANICFALIAAWYLWRLARWRPEGPGQ